MGGFRIVALQAFLGRRWGGGTGSLGFEAENISLLLDCLFILAGHEGGALLLQKIVGLAQQVMITDFSQPPPSQQYSWRTIFSSRRVRAHVGLNEMILVYCLI